MATPNATGNEEESNAAATSTPSAVAPPAAAVSASPVEATPSVEYTDRSEENRATSQVSNREMPSTVSIKDSVEGHESLLGRLPPRTSTAEELSAPMPKEKKDKKDKDKKKSHKHTVSKNLPFIPAANEKTTEDGETKDDDGGKIRLGICAMDKKARSKPMAEILSRLDEETFQVVFFGDDVILNKPVEEWPTCHVLIAFYSRGYPLEKALEYVELRKPFTLNDLRMQKLLKDRRRVYDLLQGSGIDVPRHVYLSRDDYVSTGTGDGDGNRDQEVVEFDDHIEINGVNIHKPFVEKPVS